MNKQWERQFAAGWDEIYNAQRYERARYLVKEGIDKGASINEVARATERSGNPASRKQVVNLIDFFYVSEGVSEDHPLSGTQQGLAHAMGRYEVDPEEVSERADELIEEHGYSEGVAARAARAEIIGHQMSEDGLISHGKLLVDDPRDQSRSNIRGQGLPKSWDWNRTYEAYWGRVNEFLSFLRRTKQDEMTEPVIPRRLLKLAEDFERQSERFDVGVSKHAAKSKAGAAR